MDGICRKCKYFGSDTAEPCDHCEDHSNFISNCDGCRHLLANPEGKPCSRCTRVNVACNTDLYEKDHDGCEGCKHISKGMYDYPCKNCKGNHTGGKYPDLWESDEPDPVNHPAHYADSCSLECIHVMELTFGTKAVMNFCTCNAFKYLWRYKNKNGMEDLKKAQWYITKAHDLGNTSEQLARLNELADELSKNY